MLPGASILPRGEGRRRGVKIAKGGVRGSIPFIYNLCITFEIWSVVGNWRFCESAPESCGCPNLMAEIVMPKQSISIWARDFVEQSQRGPRRTFAILTWIFRVVSIFVWTCGGHSINNFCKCFFDISPNFLRLRGCLVKKFWRLNWSMRHIALAVIPQEISRLRRKGKDRGKHCRW